MIITLVSCLLPHCGVLYLVADGHCELRFLFFTSTPVVEDTLSQ
jgi:hypothetical protein